MIKLSEPKTPCAISLFPNFPSKSATIFVPSFSFKIISFFLTNLLTIFNFPEISAVLILYDLEFFAIAVPKVSILL